MKIVLVIPTYNEAANIEPFLDILASEFPKMPQHVFEILIVDGNSPDGTPQLVRKKMEEFDFVHLLVEKKKTGLGTAYTSGFKYAMENFSPDVLVEMDADFQHDPKDVLRLIQKIDEGADYVIGSRFTKGGSIPKEWSLNRKFLSIGGNIFSKVVLGIYNVSDFTSGFKASRVKGFVDRLDLDSVLSAGFAYKIDLLFKMHKLGARISEIPIHFGLRDRGSSKMEKNNTFDSLRVVLTLRYNENKNFIKFCIVGFIGLFTDTSFFNIFRLTLFSSRTAALVSGLIAMVTTFTLNNYWSFKERKIQKVSNKIFGFVVYVGSSFVPVFVRSKLVGYAVHTFSDTFLVSNTAFIIGVLFGLIWNYVVYSKIIWRKS